FGKGGPVAAKGARVYSISLEGEVVKKDFEHLNDEIDDTPFLTFNNIEVTDGVLNLDLVASRNKASISGIAIIQGGEDLDEMKPPFLENQDSDAIYLNTGSPVNVEYEGNLFLGDQNYDEYFNSPYTFTNKAGSQEPLFQTERLSALDKTSALKYSVPVENGTYIVKTYHNELWFGKSGPSAAAGRRVFDILIEGQVVKEKHDKFVASSNEQAVLTFADIVVKDGVLNLDLIAHKDRASISGIAIIPASSSPSQKVLPTAFYSAFYNIGDQVSVDYEGDTFLGEQSVGTYHNKSNTFKSLKSSSHPLFQSERNATTLKYEVPVPNGTYTVETYHSELWWGGSGPTAGSGKRVFSIALQGQIVKGNFDIFKENRNQPTKLTFENVTVEDGVLNLELMASKDRATISGLAIFGESDQSTTSGANLRTLSTAEDTLLTEETVDTGLGTEIVMYPNPASQSTRISVNHEIGLETILVHNMNGQLIQHLDPNSLKDGAGGFVISLAGIPQGVYLISLVSKTEMIKQMRLIVKP
ncbi:MAG TPA: malectin domain-containing carbohydrate-binding protein, partial [Aequorivita sp.]|nr:malectin domain-containing carbohydrate-binding protein [Aequorivita sp.]